MPGDPEHSGPFELPNNDDDLCAEIEKAEAEVARLAEHLDALKRRALARGTSDVHDKAAEAVKRVSDEKKDEGAN